MHENLCLMTVYEFILMEFVLAINVTIEVALNTIVCE